MAVIYLAKIDGLPVGVFSTVDLAKLVSDDFEVVDVRISPENTTLYYTNAVCPILTMTNGVPKSEDLILGPVISQSADEALSQLYDICQKKRLSGIILNVFYCFEIDKNYGDDYSEPAELSVYKPWEYTNWNKAPNCANDPLIQEKWDSLLTQRAFNLDALTLQDATYYMSVNHPGIDLQSSFNSFSLNMLVQKLTKMSVNNESIYMLIGDDDPYSFTRVSIDQVGFLAFFDEASFENNATTFGEGYSIKCCKVSSVINSFIEDPEYGLYFAHSIPDQNFTFISKSIIERVFTCILEMNIF